MNRSGPTVRRLDVMMVAAAACCAVLYVWLLSATWASIRGIWVFVLPLAWIPLVVTAGHVIERLYRAACRRATVHWVERFGWEDGARGEAHFAVHEDRTWWGPGPVLLVVTGMVGLMAPGLVFDLVALFHVAVVFLTPVLHPTRRFGRFTVAPGGMTLHWLDREVVGTSWGRVEDVVISSLGGLRIRGEGRELMGPSDVVVDEAEVPRLRDTIAACWPARAREQSAA